MYKTLALTGLFLFLAGVVIAGNGDEIRKYKEGVDSKGSKIVRIPCFDFKTAPQIQRIDKTIGIKNHPLKVDRKILQTK